MIPTEPGIYYGLPFDKYRAIDAVNHGLLWTMESKSPLHALWQLEHPDEETPALRIGRAAHSAILEPETFFDHWAVAPDVDRRTKDGKQAFADFEAGIGGRGIVTAAEYADIQAMATAIEGQRLHRLVRTGRAEVVLIWDDPDTGLRCKARLDYLHQERGLFVIDLKTAECAAEEAFAYSVQKYGYFSQAAFYCMGCEEVIGQTPGYTWLVAEKSAPYAVAGYQIQAATLNAGTEFCRRALQRYARCATNDDWPGYPDEVKPLDMPKWRIEREMSISQYQM